MITISVSQIILNGDGRVKTTKIGNTTLVYSSHESYVKLQSVRTPVAHRGTGSARSALDTFLKETDALDLPVFLDASPLDRKTGLSGLVKFYQSLGFQLTGKKVNAMGDPEMKRKPT